MGPSSRNCGPRFKKLTERKGTRGQEIGREALGDVDEGKEDR